MHRVPVRVALRQCPPLTPRRREVEDRVHDVSPGVPHRTAHPTATGVRLWTRSAIRAHSSSVISPWAVRQVPVLNEMSSLIEDIIDATTTLLMAELGIYEEKCWQQLLRRIALFGK